MQIDKLAIYIIVCVFSLLIFYISMRMLYKFIIKKAKQNTEFRNDLLSLIYMIINLAPNVAAFSLVSIFTKNNNEDNTTLIIIFIFGVFLLFVGRKLKKSIYNKTKKEFTSFKQTDVNKIIKGFHNEN